MRTDRFAATRLLMSRRCFRSSLLLAPSPPAAPSLLSPAASVPIPSTHRPTHPAAHHQSALHKNREEPKQLRVLRAVVVRKGPRQQTPRGQVEMVCTGTVIDKEDSAQCVT